MDTKKILFVCTGNTCRSPMAEALFNHRAERTEGCGYRAFSKGVSVFGDSPPSAQAVAAIKEWGGDISAHRAARITEKDIEDADLILAMTTAHRNLLQSMAPGATDKIHTLYGFGEEDFDRDILDPYGGNLALYCRCRDELLRLVDKILEKLNSH